MAKRRLPPGYRLGAIAFLETCRRWREECPTEPMSMAFDLRMALADQSETFCLGFYEALALHLQMTILEGGPPVLDTWDPILELEDPLAWLEDRDHA